MRFIYNRTATSTLLKISQTISYHHHPSLSRLVAIQKAHHHSCSTTNTTILRHRLCEKNHHLTSFLNHAYITVTLEPTLSSFTMLQTYRNNSTSSSSSPPPIIATADLCDDFITSPDRLSVVNPSPRFYNYGRITSFFGKIYTIRCFESNPLVRKTLSQPGNGQVLVVDGGASQRVAILGDELAKLAHDNNWAGVIINGCIRDSKAIGMMDVGVKALGTHPLKSIKNHEGEGGVIVSFSGVEFVHGHWLYSDEVRYIQTLCIFL
uniref:4-hydroxy-4-methyl-2-oxoglutarate aldolase n=1 Tax=Ditylum brightwellii TaxID=49249 RepID=A0A7S4QRK3_9STRA